MPEPLTPEQLAEVRAAVGVLQSRPGGSKQAMVNEAIATILDAAPQLLAMVEAAAREHEQLSIATQALESLADRTPGVSPAWPTADDALIQMSVVE